MILGMFFFSIGAYPNEKNTKGKEEVDSVIPFKDRIAIRTNALDWVALLPNFGLEFDVAGKPHNVSLNLNVKANFTSFHSLPVKWIYDITDIRLEARKYIRTSSAQGKKDEATRKDKFQNFLRWKSFSPRFWRAYYIGGYVNAGAYNLKFKDLGRKGRYIGGGMTFGYLTPLYQYRHGSLDFEIGGSLGFVYTELDTYNMVTDNSYNYVTRNMRKFIPYPIITDFKVGFVYRFNTLQEKYKESNSVYANISNRIYLREQERITRKAEKERREKAIADSIANVRYMESLQQSYGHVDSSETDSIDVQVTENDSITVSGKENVSQDKEKSGKKKDKSAKRKSGKRKNKDKEEVSSGETETVVESNAAVEDKSKGKKNRNKRKKKEEAVETTVKDEEEK